ncbi:MAG: glycosyltransferase family 4 protein [Spirulinaceae cyanobacterium]
MENQRLKVLMIVEQCNPEWPSVPLVGYNFYHHISQKADVTLVTHERNREALSKVAGDRTIIYISETSGIKKYYTLVEKLVARGKVIWPLYHALTYPIYAEFNQKVYQQFRKSILKKKYDLVHALTPMLPRYPVKTVRSCEMSHTPFLLGPINGGVPFPPGFRETAKKENANLNFLRALGRYLIPGYRETYQTADRILSGSSYTLNLVKELFDLERDRLGLFYENGIPETFIQTTPKPANSDKIKLLFVGRLVPYKCADVVIEAISLLDPELQNKIQFTIVGSGEENQRLKQQAKNLKLENSVNFTGQVKQAETLQYYQDSDIFCFPSIREFGGAVVLEAMASGLPCIVANNGGIGEYVTEDNGFKIDPLSREYLVKEMADKIAILAKDSQLRSQMSANAIERAKAFIWPNKAQQMVEIYQEMISC